MFLTLLVLALSVSRALPLSLFSALARPSVLGRFTAAKRRELGLDTEELTGDNSNSNSEENDDELDDDDWDESEGCADVYDDGGQRDADGGAHRSRERRVGGRSRSRSGSPQSAVELAAERMRAVRVLPSSAYLAFYRVSLSLSHYTHCFSSLAVYVYP